MTDHSPALTDEDKPTGFKKQLINENKLGLEAPNGIEGKAASLTFGFQNNNPRVVVWTRDPADTVDFGQIRAQLDMPSFYSFIELLRMALNATGPVEYIIDNENFTYENNVKSDKPVKVSELHVGRDEDGCVWISVYGQNRPKIKFHLAPTKWHHFRHANGTAFTKKENSDIFTRAYISMLTEVMATTGVTNYVIPEKREQGAAGGYQKKLYQAGPSGSYQKKPYNGGGNYQKPAYNNNNQKPAYQKPDPVPSNDIPEDELPF